MISYVLGICVAVQLSGCELATSCAIRCTSRSRLTNVVIASLVALSRKTQFSETCNSALARVVLCSLPRFWSFWQKWVRQRWGAVRRCRQRFAAAGSAAASGVWSEWGAQCARAPAGRTLSVSACDPSSPVAFSVTQFPSPLVSAVPALVRIRHKMLAFVAVDTVCVTVLQSV